MTFRQLYQKCLLIVFACLLPFAVCSTAEDDLDKQRIASAMRMIGHEVLACAGDLNSRVLPIETTDQTYKISFETEFGIDPQDMAAVIGRVMKETGIASHYFVQVQQCETEEFVHSYEVRNATNMVWIPCKGRLLPEDCYNLLITILDTANSTANLAASTSENSAKTTKVNRFKSAFIIILLLNLIGLIGYFVRKRNANLPNDHAMDTAPDLIWIGATRFDKRNMVLSYENNSVVLTNKEVGLLALLHAYANTPVEREVLLQQVWGDEGNYVGRTLDVFISKLRKKLEADPSVKIVNIRGIGYKLVMDMPG